MSLRLSPPNQSTAIQEVRTAHIRHGGAIGRALASSLTAAGVDAGFYGQTRVLSLWGAVLHVKLAWTKDGLSWQIPHRATCRKVDQILLVRMRGPHEPLDYFVVRPEFFSTRFPRTLQRDVPDRLRRFWCDSVPGLIARLKKL